MAKVNVKICMGTTCFIMGGSKLQDLVDIVNSRYNSDVEVVGITCLDMCGNSSSKAPYVMVNETVISEATLDKVLQVIDSELNADGK